MGHLKANCPKITRQYPLNNDIAAVNSVDVLYNSAPSKGDPSSPIQIGVIVWVVSKVLVWALVLLKVMMLQCPPIGPSTSNQECVCEEWGPSVHIPDVESTIIGRCWELGPAEIRCTR